jgi:hypothetical protein
MRQAYVSGKYSDPDPAIVLHNIRAALEAAILLARHGWNPIVPHVSMNHTTAWDLAMSKDKMTLHTLDPQTDVLVMLPSWWDSPGACEEVELAHKRGIPRKQLAEVLCAP